MTKPQQPIPSITAHDEQTTGWLRLRRAWAGHLDEFEWSHFVTLTSRLPATSEQLRREFDRGYVRRLARIAQAPVPWFRVIEHGAGSAHVHALLAGTGQLSIEALRATWRLGHTHVERYDARRGGAYYLTKDLGGQPDAGVRHEPDYDLSRRQPPRRLASAA